MSEFFIAASLLLATPSSLAQSRAAQIPNSVDKVRYVRDFVSSGSGTSGDPFVSADGTGGIQAAIDSCPSTGCRVILQRGSYENARAIFIKSNVWLSGEGMRATIIKRKAATQTDRNDVTTGPILTAGPSSRNYYDSETPGSNITVSDLTLDGNSMHQTATTNDGGFQGIRFSKGPGGMPYGNIDGVTIRRVEVKNMLQDGIYVSNSRNVLIDSCATYRTGQIASCQAKNGITVAGDESQREAGWNRKIVIARNRVSYSGDATARCAEGIATIALDDVTISANDISHVDVGIELNNHTRASTLSDYTISDNTIHDNVETSVFGGYGISTPTADATSRFRNVRIVGNNFYNLHTSALAIARVDGLTVSGNTVERTNTVAFANADRAITILGCHGGSVNHNTIWFKSPVSNVAGITIQGLGDTDTTDGLAVAENSIWGLPTKRAGSCGVVLSGGASETVVEANEIVGGDYGVTVASYGRNFRNYIVNNLISEIGTSDIEDRSGRTNTVIRVGSPGMQTKAPTCPGSAANCGVEACFPSSGALPPP